MSFGLPYTLKMSGERYVYYKRLATDFNGKYLSLYEKAKKVENYRVEQGGDPAQIADYFASLRNAEYQKEAMLLNMHFGGSFNYKNPSSIWEGNNNKIGAELIEAFNYAFNLKNVFERNLALITQTKGQKQLITFFIKYFYDQVRKNKQYFLNTFEHFYKPMQDMKKALKETVDVWIPKLTRDALIFMFEEAGIENGIDKKATDDMREAYRELAEPLKQRNALGNALINSFIKTYKLDEFADFLLKKVDDTNQLKNKIKNFDEKGDHYTIDILGGGASENFGNFLVNYIKENLGGPAEGFLTGSTKQKADMIYTIGVPTNRVEQWLDENTFGTRPQNIEAIQRLQNVLADFNEGFIVYVNAKNYTLNDMFANGIVSKDGKQVRIGGFNAGDPINLQTWDTMMHLITTKERDLIFAIMQLIPGAVGQGNEEKVSNLFARAIASALFDDFNTVGVVQKSGPKSIHLMYLDGVYVPLSFFYATLEEAFREYSMASVSEIVEVTFKLPSRILFWDQDEQNKWMNNNPGKSAWREQQQNALNNIKVSYHFLRAFQKLMQQLKF